MAITDQYYRNCPECKKEIFYTRKSSLERAVLENRLCNFCKFKGNRGFWYGTHGCCLGKHHTEETKKKLSNIKKGKKFTNEHKKNLSKSLMGCTGYWKNKKLSIEHIKKISINSPKIWLNKNLTEETKLKLRISKLNRIKKFNISTKEDKGAKEYFQWLNMYSGFNFKPKRFWNLGYDADGYDEDKHIWIEYDTPYHRGIKQREKDKIRQENIIKYFEQINKPLSEFIRIEDDGIGNIKSKSVYKGI